MRLLSLPATSRQNNRDSHNQTKSCNPKNKNVGH